MPDLEESRLEESLRKEESRLEMGLDKPSVYHIYEDQSDFFYS